MTHERRSAALIQRVREETLRRIRDDQKGAPEDVAEILTAIERGIFDADFDLGELRRSCGPSAETLRAFRARFGGAFKSYVTDRRLAAAKRLVDEPEVDPAEIAELLGFADGDLFRRWFKRWTGKTPEQRRAARRPRPPARREPGAPEGADWPPISLWFRARAAALEPEEVTRFVRLIRLRCTRGAPRRSGVVS